MLAFKSDFEIAFKHLSKVRTRVKDITAIKEHFNLLLEENFEDIFPKSDVTAVAVEEKEEELVGGKKRSRTSDADKDEAAMKKTPRATKKDGDDKVILPTTATTVTAAATATVVVKMTYNEKVREKQMCSAVSSSVLLYIDMSCSAEFHYSSLVFICVYTCHVCVVLYCLTLCSVTFSGSCAVLCCPIIYCTVLICSVMS